MTFDCLIEIISAVCKIASKAKVIKTNIKPPKLKMEAEELNFVIFFEI